MSKQIQQICLEEQSIRNFFEDAIESGVNVKDCHQYLSVLLERCCMENRTDSLFPVVEAMAQKVQEVSLRQMPNHNIIQSIH